MDAVNENYLTGTDHGRIDMAARNYVVTHPLDRIESTQEAQQQHFQIVEQWQRRVSARTRHESVTTNTEELSYGMGD